MVNNSRLIPKVTSSTNTLKVFQPTLVAAQAHSLKSDRAVVISVRNFLRAFGGSLGLALSSAIFSNALKRALNALSTPLPADLKSGILDAILKVPDLSVLTLVQRDEVLDSYMKASHTVFLLWVPLIGACLVLCIFIRDKGLTRPEEKEKIPAREEIGSDGEVVESGESDLEMRTQEVSKKA